jgi:sigma-B regulation protein RsbU (phosphoserine phosphatase)
METENKRLSKLSLLLPLGIFAGAIFIDINILSGVLDEASSENLREWFIIVAFALSFPLVYKQKWASDRNVLRGLRFVFFLVLFTYIAFLISKANFVRIHGELNDMVSIYSDYRSYLFVMSWAFFLTIFVLLSLGMLRNLIFIKRKKSTARNFNLLMVALFIFSLMNAGFFRRHTAGAVQGNSFTLNYVFSFIVINLMVINSFRVSWINYLNKKQKLACFWGGIIFLPLQVHLNIILYGFNMAEIFSPALGQFVVYSVLFLTVYIAFAFIALLAHLPTAKLYDKKMHQISSLHNLSRAVSSEFEIDKLVRSIVRLANEVTESDFSWLELADKDSGKLELVSARNLTESEKKSWQPSTESQLDKWFVEHAEPFLSNQVVKSPSVKNLKKWKKELESVAAVALRTGGHTIGFLYVGKRVTYGFEQDDVDMLRAFSEQAVVAIENARLVKESIIKERLEEELKIAHETQRQLLPKSMPVVPGFGIDAICNSANEVGGDYYDFFQLNKDKTGVVVGDVSGKGASAAFYMAEIKGIMQALARSNRTPKQTLISANRIFYENIDRKNFVTLIYGIIDAKKKRFTFCRAGHCPILLASGNSDGVRLLEPKGIGLGLDPGDLFDETLEECSIVLEKNQVLLLYTDGATDALNDDGELYGEQRLEESFWRSNQLDLSAIKEQLVKDLFEFLGEKNIFDDMTCVIIKAV